MTVNRTGNVEWQLSEKLGIPLLTPRVFGDARGFFFESWKREVYEEIGVPSDCVQDNFSSSTRGVLRGLHFQNPNGQGKLVTVLEGEVYDVAVDIRVGSPRFGMAEGFILSKENRKQLFVPAGYAHGFLVRSESALFAYKVMGAPYDPSSEHSLSWKDPALAIDWPTTGTDGQPLEPELKPADAEAPTLAELQSAGKLPTFED